MTVNSKKNLQPAVFLDRDGTINEDIGYMDSAEKLRLYPYAGSAIRQLNKLGFKVIVVTNQSGIARGYFEEARVPETHQRMDQLLALENARIDTYYYCPHHPEGKVAAFRQVCDCRKPAPGMLQVAAREHDIDLSASFMIGDKYSDIGAGHRLGLTTILLETGEGLQQYQEKKDNPSLPQPDHISSNLLSAIEWIARQSIG